eukprot:SAG31_NODE_31455_length_368_cov_0.639405_1_plen_30_part_01
MESVTPTTRVDLERTSAWRGLAALRSYRRE